jgi:ubiquinone/menaquinone biosynthesis C-methylase UbiE
MSINSESSTYFADEESPVEVARVLRQDDLLTAALEQIGEFLPSTLAPATVRTVLDIACGGGGWPRAVARRLPKARVTGFDISEEMIKVAQVRASASRLANVEFLRQDAHSRPWPFPAEFYDLVNARLISTFMTRELWPPLLAECFRIQRPGGVMRIIDLELAISNSLSLERLNHNFTISMHKLRRTFSETGRSMGTAPMLKPLLRQAGYQDIQQRGFAVDLSAGTPAQRDWFEDFKAIHFSLGKLRGQYSQIDPKEAEELFEQACIDFLKSDFTFMLFFFMSWGRKEGA